MRKPRWVQNRERNQADQDMIRDAVMAVGLFRRRGDASGFPDLQKALQHVNRANPGRKIKSLRLDAFGYRDPGLTWDEYEEFEAAYKATTDDL